VDCVFPSFSPSSSLFSPRRKTFPFFSSAGAAPSTTRVARFSFLPLSCASQQYTMSPSSNSNTCHLQVGDLDPFDRKLSRSPTVLRARGPLCRDQVGLPSGNPPPSGPKVTPDPAVFTIWNRRAPLRVRPISRKIRHPVGGPAAPSFRTVVSHCRNPDNARSLSANASSLLWRVAPLGLFFRQ